MCICMYVYIYIYIYIHTHTNTCVYIYCLRPDAWRAKEAGSSRPPYRHRLNGYLDQRVPIRTVLEAPVPERSFDYKTTVKVLVIFLPAVLGLSQIMQFSNARFPGGLGTH